MNKVLIIEDDETQLLLFQTVFNMRGLSASVASTTDEVLRATADDKPDVIISDIILWGEDGLDIIEKLKQNEATKDIPVFIFTNTNKKEYQDRAKDLGVIDFVIKSEVMIHDFADRIKMFLENKK